MHALLTCEGTLEFAVVDDCKIPVGTGRVIKPPATQNAYFVPVLKPC